MTYYYDFKTKEQKQKYYLDHKTTYLEKVECKDCKKLISKINLKKHLLTKAHLNLLIKLKLKRLIKKQCLYVPVAVNLTGVTELHIIKPRYINYMSKTRRKQKNHNHNPKI